MNTKNSIVLAALLATLAVAPGQAATVTQAQTNDTPGESWANSATWSNNATPSLANDYVSGSGKTLRSPTTTDSTFGGNSLTLDGSQFNATGNNASAGVINIADLRATNGAAIVNGNGGSRTQTLTGALDVSGSMFFRLSGSSTPKSITVSSQITGSGDIGFIQHGTLTLNSLVGNTFDGTWTVGGSMTVLGSTYTNIASTVSILDATSASSLGLNSSLVADSFSEIHVGYDWETEGSVTLNLDSLTYLDTDWTVGALTINGTSLGAGTYDYSYFDSNYGAFFDTTGIGGSITVVPEPATLGLMAMAAGALLLRRRRK